VKFVITQDMKDCVLRVLRVGKGNARTARDIERMAGIRYEKHTSWYTRRVIKALNADGIPIVSGSLGFWVTEDREELLRYARSLEERADQNEARAAMVRTIAESMEP